MILHKPGKKYCKRCWRDDYHVPMRLNSAVAAGLILATMGLALLIWPYRCATCGFSGIKSWVNWNKLLSRKSQEMR